MRAIALAAAVLAMGLPVRADTPPTPEQQEFGRWLSEAIPAEAPDASFVAGDTVGIDGDLQVYSPSVQTAEAAKPVAEGAWLVRGKVRHARTGVLLETVRPQGWFAGAPLADGAPLYAIGLTTLSDGDVTAWCTPQQNDQGLGKFVVGACFYRGSKDRAYFAHGSAGMASSLFTNNFGTNSPRLLDGFPNMEERRVSFETPVAFAAALVDVDRRDVDISLLVLGAGQVSFLGQLHPRRDAAGGFELTLLGKTLRFAPGAARDTFTLQQ